MRSVETKFSRACGLRRFAYLWSFSVLLLIFKGALVSSHDAGLAVPDWPTSFGENMFLFSPAKWVGPVYYEHVHRLFASLVGALTVVLTIWTALVERRRWLRNLTFAALGIVILQGVLGGLTVLFLLPVAISTAHGVLAQSFFVLSLIIAYSHSAEAQRLLSVPGTGEKNRLASSLRPIARAAIFVAVVVFLQLVLGAVMRHSGAGLAVPDFPTVGGTYLPPFDHRFLESINRLRQERMMLPVSELQVGLHLAHRLMAVVVVGAILVLAVSWRKRSITPELRRRLGGPRGMTLAAVMLVTVQFFLGVLTVWSERDPFLASLHVVSGALLLGLSVLLAARLYVNAAALEINRRDVSAESPIDEPSATNAL